jgi:hypothetical protein
MPAYPGLGLPLRHNNLYRRSRRGPPGSNRKPWSPFYPIGVNDRSEIVKTPLLPVRELAMMDIMERLTDLPDWHTRVFDDHIVAQWQAEALNIADEYFWQLATRGRWQNY